MLEKLRDIKDIVQVTDYSFIYLIALCIVILLIILLAVYKYMQPKKRKKPTQKELALIKLKNINFENQKEVAYDFYFYAVYFLNDKNENRYKELVERLEPFKYKKDVPPLEAILQTEIKEFIKDLK